MTPTTRARTVWLLVALTAAYSIANILVFYVTNSFGPVWFTASLLVYACLGAFALYLAFVDAGEPAPPSTGPSAVATPVAAVPTLVPTPGPSTVAPGAGKGVVRREILHETPTGRRVLREGDDNEATLTVTGPAGARRLQEIEAEIDAADFRPATAPVARVPIQREVAS